MSSRWTAIFQAQAGLIHVTRMTLHHLHTGSRRNPLFGQRVHALASVAVAKASGGSSTNGSSDTPKRPRKHVRRPCQKREKNAAKAKRAKGEEYVSPTTGKFVPARKTGPACCCVRRKCYDSFTEEEKSAILQQFNSLANKEP